MLRIMCVVGRSVSVLVMASGVPNVGIVQKGHCERVVSLALMSLHTSRLPPMFSVSNTLCALSNNEYFLLVNGKYKSVWFQPMAVAFVMSMFSHSASSLVQNPNHNPSTNHHSKCASSYCVCLATLASVCWLCMESHLVCSTPSLVVIVVPSDTLSSFLFQHSITFFFLSWFKPTTIPSM